jgi:mycoredoxin
VSMDEKTITIYGTWWCGDCAWVKRYFDKKQIRYMWVDIDKDLDAEKFVLATNQGMRSVPTIVFPDGSILVEPGISELENKLSTEPSARQ